MNINMSTSLLSTWLRLFNLLKLTSLLPYLELFSLMVSQETETIKKYCKKVTQNFPSQ